MRLHLLRLLVLCTAFGQAPVLTAAPFHRAQISRIHNRVTLIDPAAGTRPAVVRDVVTGDMAVQTGLESRAELQFPDNTLTRLASNTVFSFRSGTRQLELQNGAILFQVPSGSGGVQIHAAAITAAITGTTGFVERIGNVFKLIVLEGEVRTSLRGRLRESMIVRGGQMLIAPLNSTSMKDWQAVDIDIEKLTRSSKLLDSRLFRPLSSTARADIHDTIADQQVRLTRGRLQRTNMVIDGGVTQVLLVDSRTRDRSDSNPRGRNPQPTNPQPVFVPPVAVAPIDDDPVPPGPQPTPNPSPTPNPNSPPGATPPVITRPDPYVISRATTITTGPMGQAPRIVTEEFVNTGRVYRGPAQDGSPAQFVFGSTTPFDLASNFDARFGRNFEPAFAPGGVAVFRFRSLRLIGPPTINTSGGPIDLALVATGTGGGGAALRSGSSGGAWDLSGLRSLFLGAGASSILLDDSIGFFASGPTFQYLQLYARGAASDVLLGATLQLNRNLYIDAARDILFNDTAAASGRSFYLNAGRDVLLSGTTTAQFLQLYGGRRLGVDGTVTATTFFGFGETAQVNGSLTGDRVEFTLTGAFENGESGSRITARELFINTTAFSLNADEENGTVTDTSGLALLEVNTTTLDVLSNFTIPEGAIGNLTIASNLDAPNRSLLGFHSIITSGSGTDRLGDLGTRSFVGGGHLLVSRDLMADFVTVDGNLEIGRDLLPFSSDTTLLRIVMADRIAIDRGIDFSGANGHANPATPPQDGFSLQLHSSEILFADRRGMPDPDLFAINGANLNGGDAFPPTSFEGGSGGTLSIGNDAQPIAGDVELAAPITATTGRNGNDVDFGGNGGTVNVVANGTITLSSSIEVSDKSMRRLSRRGGNVRLTSNRLTGTAIRVASTAQISSLLAAGAPGPGGEIVFRSPGGDIDISGTVTADRGRVEMENTGTNGRVVLNGATISADVVRARAFGENGQLIVGGGSISADTVLKLYADGSNGTVLFNGNVALNGTSTKIITGNTVTIAPGVNVFVGGPAPAQVYTNNANYTGFGGNNTSTGTWSGAGATTQPRALAPGY